jgi:hypothetical protein
MASRRQLPGASSNRQRLHGLDELKRLLQTTYKKSDRQAIMNTQRSKPTPVLALEHSSGSVDPRTPSSQLDGSVQDSVRAEDSEREESEYSGYVGGAQEQEGITKSDGRDHSEEHESPSSQHLRSWASGNKRAKTADGAGSSRTSIYRFDQRSVFTEASFPRGSFFPPINGSYLSPVHLGPLHENQSSPSPPHFESVPYLWGVR